MRICAYHHTVSTLYEYSNDVFPCASDSENWAVIKAALVAGYYPNTLRVDRPARRLIAREQFDVRPHASSVLANHVGLQRSLAAPVAAAAPDVNTELVAPSFEQHLLALPSDWLIYDEMARSPLGI